jgi:hypothetical protein
MFTWMEFICLKDELDNEFVCVCGTLGPLQDDYTLLDLQFHRQTTVQMEAMHEQPSANVGEVEGLRMVVECFNKYDNINVNGQGIEKITTCAVEDAPVEDFGGEDNFSMQDNDNTYEAVDASNDAMEREGTSTNMNDPTSVDMEVLLREAQTPLYAGSTSNRLTSTLMLLVSCITFGVPNNFVDELLKLLKETI